MIVKSAQVRIMSCAWKRTSKIGHLRVSSYWLASCQASCGDRLDVCQVSKTIPGSPGMGMPIALAYIKRGSLEPGTQLEVEAAGQRRTAEVTALPFSIKC